VNLILDIHKTFQNDSFSQGSHFHKTTSLQVYW